MLPLTCRQPHEMYRWGNAPRRGGRGKNLLGLRRLLLRGNSEIFPPPIGLGFAAVGYGRKSRAANAFRKKSLAKSCMVAGKSVPLPASLGQIFFPPPLTTSFGFVRGHPPGERPPAIGFNQEKNFVCNDFLSASYKQQMMIDDCNYAENKRRK